MGGTTSGSGNLDRGFHICICGCGRNDLVGSDLMDPVIIIVALIILAVEIYIRLL
jgi:hypothetical protein